MALNLFADQIEMLTERVDTLGREIAAEVRRDNTMRRLATIPGIGPITAATNRNANTFSSIRGPRGPRSLTQPSA